MAREYKCGNSQSGENRTNISLKKTFHNVALSTCQVIKKRNKMNICIYIYRHSFTAKLKKHFPEEMHHVAKLMMPSSKTNVL